MVTLVFSDSYELFNQHLWVKHCKKLYCIMHCPIALHTPYFAVYTADHGSVEITEPRLLCKRVCSIQDSSILAELINVPLQVSTSEMVHNLQNNSNTITITYLVKTALSSMLYMQDVRVCSMCALCSFFFSY